MADPNDNRKGDPPVGIFPADAAEYLIVDRMSGADSRRRDWTEED